MYRGLLLDMDGTMLDSHAVSIRQYNEMARKKWGRDLEEEEKAKLFSSSLEQMMKHFGLPDDSEGGQAAMDILNHWDYSCELFPGIAEVVHFLHEKKIPLGIVTSRNREELERGFEPYPKLREAFACTVSCDDVKNHKPAPDPVLLALERLSLSPKEALFVGDSLHDYWAAREACTDFGVAGWGVSGRPSFPHAAHFLKVPEDILTLSFF